MTAQRTELLAALLTIWRWGRLVDELSKGRPLGSFPQWCRWVRDPLIAIGCQDPVEQMSEAKASDERRRQVAELYQIWWIKHEDKPTFAGMLDSEVQRIADPHKRGRQYLTSYLEKRAATRIAGYVLTRQEPIGKWGTATYALSRTNEQNRHRAHRGHRLDYNAAGESDSPCLDRNGKITDPQVDVPYDPYASYGHLGHRVEPLAKP